MEISKTPFIVIQKKQFFNMSFRDVFILDIGTDTIKVYSKHQDLILQEANVIITQIHSSKVLAYGNIGKTIYNKLPINYTCSRPIKNGKISDVRLITLMLKYIFTQISSTWHFSKAICYCIVNSNINQDDKEIINSILKKLQIGKTYFLNMTNLYLSLLQDSIKEQTFLLLEQGAGYTQISIILNNTIIASKELMVTGNYLDLQIINYIAKHFNMYIGEFEAKQIKENYGSATELFENDSFEIYGKDLITSYHKKFKLTSSHIHFAIQNALNGLVTEIINFLISQNDELKLKLQETLKTLYITGGVSHLQNLDKFLHKELELEIKTLDNDYATICNLLYTKNILDNKKQAENTNISQELVSN